MDNYNRPNPAVSGGTILWVNQRDNVAFLSLGSDDNLQRKTTFNVYPAGTANVTGVVPKGKVEVTNITGTHTSEARIVENPIGDPLLPGDLVHTIGWAPGQHPHYAIGGVVDLNGSGTDQTHKLREMIEATGGVVDAEVMTTKGDENKLVGRVKGAITINTRYLILGDPKVDTPEGAARLQPTTTLITEANRLHVEQIGLNKFLSMIGYVAPSGVGPGAAGATTAGTIKGGPNNAFQNSFRPRQPGAARRCDAGTTCRQPVLNASSRGKFLDRMSDELEIIAHRGASWDAPENSRAAVELAWRQGADAIEADFRLTQDGQIVASHDDSLKRVTGVDLRISEHSLDALRELDVGSWKGPQWSGERIATLEEMLAVAAPPDARFYVEIKCGPEIAAELVRVVQASGWAPTRIVPICYSAEVLVAVRRLLPQSPTYLVVEFLRDPQSGVWYPDADECLAEAVRHELTGLDLMAARASDPALIGRIRAAGLDVCVWTVDEEHEARQLMDLGVRRITTNQPAFLRERLR